jgi:hypothetical protein
MIQALFYDTLYISHYDAWTQHDILAPLRRTYHAINLVEAARKSVCRNHSKMSHVIIRAYSTLACFI